MASEVKGNSSDGDNVCVVCYKTTEIWSLGLCDHPVCFECSTRMRALCKQNECPICRRELPKVIFTRKIEPFSVLFPRFERSNLQDRKLGIYFCTSDIKDAYYKLLEDRCPICENGEQKNWPFRSFSQLKEHVRKDHGLQYCDICTENLKIFTFERRLYTRQELAQHRRKGDPDNTSHRGHPLCEFCDVRFMDSDELFRHLRRNHLFCHFCDADGKHQYYNSMDDLKKHFKEEHYLCEEGECKTMPLTGVFRTEIDLKAHITQEHGRYMSKSANKQARTLELEFTLAPRPRSENTRGRRYNEYREREEEDTGYNMEPGGPGGGDNSQTRTFVNPLEPQNFPALTNAPATSNITVRSFSKLTHAPFRGGDFPSLGGPSSSRASPAVTITTSSASRNNQPSEVTITRTREDFPALGGSASGSSTVRLSVNGPKDSMTTPKVSIQVSHSPSLAITTHITAPHQQQRQAKEFPALGACAAPTTQAQWVQPKSKREAKADKVAPCPQLPPSDLAAFPALGRGRSNNTDNKPKKTSSVTVPVSQSWVNLNSVNNNAKKNKSSDNDGRLNNDMPSTSSGDRSQSSNVEKKSQDEFSKKLESVKLVETNNKLKDSSVTDNDAKSKSKKKKSKASSSDSNSAKAEAKSSSSSSKSVNSPSKDCSNQNGLVKKRSELKIGTLKNMGDSNTSSESTTSALTDFPSLGTTKPPPGFSNSKSQWSTVKPPPGFNSENFPSLGVSNDLTFTNSTGQSYSIIPGNQYRQPSNFNARNLNLIKRFQTVLNNNEAIVDFKTKSDMFRRGLITTREYFDHCKAILGASFDEVFPELLVLLPDIGKQQELFKMIPTGSACRKNLLVCEHCKQVLFRKELSYHYNQHAIENHFPSLDSVTPPVSNVWKK